MKDYMKDIVNCLNESVQEREFDSLMQILTEVEKNFGVVLDTDIDDNGEGEFFFDTNYNRKTFETETEANDFENKYQEEIEKWCNKHGYVCNRSEDEDAPLSFWIRKKSVNEDNDEPIDWQKIQPILEKLFDGEILFDCIHDEDDTLEFRSESWHNLPSEFQIEDEIKDKLGIKTSVEYSRYDENGVIHDEGEIMSIYITPGVKKKTNEGIEDDLDYYDMFISKDGVNYAGQISRFYELDRAKRACKYYNSHSKRFAGKYVLVDKNGKIIFDKDGDRQ